MKENDFLRREENFNGLVFFCNEQPKRTEFGSCLVHTKTPMNAHEFRLTNENSLESFFVNQLGFNQFLYGIYRQNFLIRLVRSETRFIEKKNERAVPNELSVRQT